MAELYWRASTLTKDGEQHDIFMPVLNSLNGNINSAFAEKINPSLFIQCNRPSAFFDLMCADWLNIKTTTPFFAKWQSICAECFDLIQGYYSVDEEKIYSVVPFSTIDKELNKKINDCIDTANLKIANQLGDTHLYIQHI